jgi:hypothetical protein
LAPRTEEKPGKPVGFGVLGFVAMQSTVILGCDAVWSGKKFDEVSEELTASIFTVETYAQQVSNQGVDRFRRLSLRS